MTTILSKGILVGRLLLLVVVVVVVVWWCRRRRITGKWAQRTTSFDVLVEAWLHACLPWPYMDVRVQLHAPVA
jgi:hypothetical protein